MDIEAFPDIHFIFLRNHAFPTFYNFRRKISISFPSHAIPFEAIHKFHPMLEVSFLSESYSLNSYQYTIPEGPINAIFSLSSDSSKYFSETLAPIVLFYHTERMCVNSIRFFLKFLHRHRLFHLL